MKREKIRPSRRLRRQADTRSANIPNSALKEWLAPILTAVVVAVLAWFAKDVVDRDAVTDRARGLVPGGYGAEVEYDLLDYDSDGGTVAIPAGVPLSPALQRYLSSGSRVSEEDIRALADEIEDIAADPGSMTMALFMKGQRRQGIRITNMYPVEIRRGPVYDEALVFLPPQGPEQSAVMVLNFDEPQPRLRAVEGGDITKPRGLFFPTETIVLADGKQEPPVVIHSVMTKGSVSFKVRVEFMVGSQARSLTIDNRGKPFRLTAYNCTGVDRASYRRAVQAAESSVDPVAEPQRMKIDEC